MDSIQKKHVWRTINGLLFDPISLINVSSVVSTEKEVSGDSQCNDV